MISTPENFAYANKAALDAFVTFANTAFASAEHLAPLNPNAAFALDKAAKTALAGYNAAVTAVESAIVAADLTYDNFFKATKQVVEIAEANLTAPTNATVKAVGAAAKPKRAA